MRQRLFLMSDVHGYFQSFQKMMKKIRFQDADRMVILGDLAAKGPDSLGLLRYVMEHENVLALRGNHEQRLLQYFGADIGAEIPEETMRTWASGDGADVIRQIKQLSDSGRTKVLSFVSEMPFFAKIETNKKTYILVHGAPDPDFLTVVENSTWQVWNPVPERTETDGQDEVVRGEKDQWFQIMLPDRVTITREKNHLYASLQNRYPFPEAENLLAVGVTAVVGHTPTFKYGKQYAGDLIVREDKIFLDRGAGQGYGLGCLELLPVSGMVLHEKNSYQKYFTNADDRSIL